MFKFPLQRVLEMRAKREQEAAVTLAGARERAEQARRELLDLERARVHGMRRIADAQGGGGATVGQLQNLSYVLQCLDQRLSAATQVVNQADAQVEVCIRDLTAASQDRQVLDRLRDKQLQAWQAEEVQGDRKAMDAIALTRFARSTSATQERSE